MQPNKTFKDSVFRQLFSDPINLLDIFNAIENTQYTDPSLVKITTAVRDCIKENILTSFLSANEKEVINMLNTEWDLDTALKVREQEGLEEGFARGITKTTKAISMLLAGGKIDKIVHETGLPERTVWELKQQFRP